MRIPAIALATLSVLLATPAARAASEQACDGYAKSAIAQYRTAKEAGLPTPYPVWSDDYQHHYRWCLGQQDSALQSGHQQRQKQIDAAMPSATPAPSPTPPPPSPGGQGPSGSTATGPGLVIVEQLVEGFASKGEVWVDCPKGKRGLGWGFEHLANANMLRIIEANPRNEASRWRFIWAVDPLYAQAFPGDVGGVDPRRTYHIWFSLLCIDVPGKPVTTRPAPVKSYPADCAKIPLCWGP